jgi:hypothetical protein
VDNPPLQKARFVLYQETAKNFKWEIEALFDPRVYPYRVVGGKITGTICGSPHWEVEEGIFGTGLLIKAKRTTPVPQCSEFVVITGSSVSPAGYTGTYSFTPLGSAFGFKHNTLFLGFSDP